MKMEAETTLKVEQAIDLIHPIIGEYVWSVRSDEYRVLQLNFGMPHLRVREPHYSRQASAAVQAVLSRRLVIPTGKWHLFVETGCWNVRADGFEISRLHSDRTADQRLTYLDGQKLVSVEYRPESGDWLFAFDLSGQLTISNNPDFEGDAQWTLFFESGGSLSFFDLKKIVLENGH